MKWTLLLVALLLAGCLRVGSGDDLELVCEERSASPRKAYGIEFLAAQTQMDASVPADAKLALLDAARQHVITPGGRAHEAFEASLMENGTEAWRFDATGVWPDGLADHYLVDLARAAGRVSAHATEGPGPVTPPRSLLDPARAAANASADVLSRSEGAPQFAWATWDAALPSCVRLRLVGAADEATVTVNLVQSRVVDVR